MQKQQEKEEIIGKMMLIGAFGCLCMLLLYVSIFSLAFYLIYLLIYH